MRKGFVFLLFCLLGGLCYGQSVSPLPGITNEVVVQDTTIFLISTDVKKVAVNPKMIADQLAKLNEEIKKTEQYLTDLRSNLLELERVNAVVQREQKKLKKV